MFELLLQGMGVGVALAAPVGPINIEIVRRGLVGGFRAGWFVGLGALSADVIYCVLIVAGLVRVADSPVVRVPLFLAGAVVLTYLGVVGIRAALAGPTPTASAPSARRSYLAGFLMAAASPMGIVYWLSIGAALVARAVQRAGTGGAPLLVAGVFLGIFAWVTFLSTLTQGGRRFVSDVILRRATVAAGLILVAFGLSFLIQGVQALADL